MEGKPSTNQPSNSPVVIEGRKLTEGRLHYWASGTPVFTNAQLELLRQMVDEENAPAQIEGVPNKTYSENIRRTRVRWLSPTDENLWVYELIWNQANQANALFRFDLVPMHDTIQLALYDAEEEGFFKWHMDTVPADLTRKISITVPLNNGDEYEGGILEFNSGGIQRAPQIAGAPIMFPSWLLHRVTPVTAGKRYSLVAWIRGPNWR